jgi:hypothetical protein
MLNEVLKIIIKKNKHAPKQGSKEWLENRLNVFGGSEIASLIGASDFSNVKQLIAQKCNLMPFSGNIYTRWGTLFEPITKRYISIICNTKIFDTGAIKSKIEGQAYSPDGLAIVKSKRGRHLVLFEFKAPATKIPLGVIPSHYIPQILTGLNTITNASYCIFVNNMYRKCSLTQLNNDSCDYDINFHKSDFGKKTADERSAFNRMLESSIYAKGIIYFWIEDEYIDEYNKRMGKSMIDKLGFIDIDDINNLHDTSKSKVEDFGSDAFNTSSIDNILLMVSSKNIVVSYSNVVLNDLHISDNIDFDLGHLHKVRGNVSFNTLIKKHKKLVSKKVEGMTMVGFMPWKLVLSNVIEKDNESNFAHILEEKIRTYLPILKKLNSIDDVKLRIDTFFEHFKDENKYMDSRLKEMADVYNFSKYDNLIDLVDL